jgi:hypothetical protein
MQQIDEFYSKDFYFSYSGLNKLIFSPTLFFNHYILGQREDKVEAYMIEGRLIHCLLLQPEEFSSQFVVAMDKLPSDNVRSIIDRIVRMHPNLEKLDTVQNDILQIMTEVNYLQTLKTDEQRIAKLITPENVNYFEFAKNAKSLTVIDQSTLNKASEVVQLFKNNNEIIDVLKLNLTEFDLGVEVQYELPLQYKLKDYQFAGIKGILDCLVTNHNDKTLTINDLKTTSKSLLDFNESVDYYNYWLQAGMYVLLAREYMKEKGFSYEINFNFVVVDKYNQVYCFPVSPMTLKDWEQKTKATLKMADYHYTNRRYDLPYKLAISKCVL